MNKNIFTFGCENQQQALNFNDRQVLKNLLGGKGAGLAEMSANGIAVPPGFIITTEICKNFLHIKMLGSEIKAEIQKYLQVLEQNTGKFFGHKDNFLLVSVRSGAPVSMPGMMDTILNIGLNDEIIENYTGTEAEKKWLYDCYRRLLQMYASVVMNVDNSIFEEIIDDFKLENSIKREQNFSADHIKQLIDEFKTAITTNSGKEFPQNVQEQLLGAIHAVFESWNSNRAIMYRAINNIPEELGTAVNVQSMVFGNFDNNSGTGVVFSRNPSDGTKEFFGEFLLNAQGEDVVAGTRTPLAVAEDHPDSLKNKFPDLFAELFTICTKLENHFRDMQDIEFTIEKGKLWILQSRSGKRSISASIKIALNLLSEGIITEEEALLAIDVNQISSLLHDSLDPKVNYTILAKGLPASPGAVSGRIAFSAESAVEMAKSGKVLLVRQETCPEDIHGMHVAEGILTSRGGMTSHAAVVARGMGKACVCGATELSINVKKKTLQKNNVTLREGDYLTIDGASGSIIIGTVPTVKSLFSADLMTFLLLAKKHKKLGVRTNAETLLDAKAGLSFGAEGIGLCRSEHMFFASEKLFEIRKMILAETENERAAAIEKLAKMQEEDFTNLLKTMEGTPINIRLLDPPLHEFVPSKDEDIEEIAISLGKNVDRLKRIIADLAEENPMLGHRGCRLGISYPALYNMQVEAIIKAMQNVKKLGIEPDIEVMIPFIIDKKELSILKENITNLLQLHGALGSIKIGTMIELPRACLIASELAPQVDFFSFGTNDLTQTTLGISRDDAGKFLQEYQNQQIFAADPFVEIDEEGVGSLMKMAIDSARKIKKDLSISICGEHGGNNKSIEFFHKIGITYVSCSPYRVPIAIIAAAQIAIKEGK